MTDSVLLLRMTRHQPPVYTEFSYLVDHPGSASMYALLLWMPLRAHCLASVRTHFEQIITPALAGKTGFVEAHLLSGVISDQCLLVSIWRSQAALQQAETNRSLQTAFQQLGIYFARQPMVVTCEVTGSFFESSEW